MNDFYLSLGTTMCDTRSRQHCELKAYAKLEGLNFYSLIKKRKKKK